MSRFLFTAPLVLIFLVVTCSSSRQIKLMIYINLLNVMDIMSAIFIYVNISRLE